MTEYDGFVAFHSVRHLPAMFPDIVTVPGVIAGLNAHGMGALFVPRENYDWGKDEPIARGYMPSATPAEGGWTVVDPELHELAFARGAIEVVRTRIDTPQAMQGIVPIVNDMATRKFAMSKANQAGEYPDLMPASRIIEPGADITETDLDALPSGTVALKKDIGNSSLGVKIGVAKQDAQEALRGMRAELGGLQTTTPIVMQEMVPGVPLRGLRALLPDQQALINKADPAANHELGVYCFADRNELRPYAVYHLNAGTEQNTWVPLDQESVPEEFIAVAGAVVATMLKRTESAGAVARVDLFEDAAGRVRMRELNGHDPGLGSMLTLDSTLQREQARLLTEQLVALAGR